MSAAAVVLVAGSARGDSAPPPQPPASAADVADAPRADEARNQTRSDHSAARALLWIPRAVLFPIKWGFWATMAPVRGTMYAFDRYQVGMRIASLLTGDGPIALYPSAKAESGFGITYGIGAGVSNLFDRGERLRFQFLFGGEVRQIYGGKATSGRLFGDVVSVDFEVQLQQLNNSRFFGIGNLDLQDASLVGSGNDPTGVATVARFDQDILRGELGANLHVADGVTLRLSGALLERTFSGATDEDAADIRDVYDEGRLVGFDRGTSTVYAEASAEYDMRDQPSRYLSAAAPSAGWQLSGFAGWTQGLDVDPSDYLRWGVDAQRYVDVFRGDRVLIVRGQVEAVTADLDGVAFTDLPALGGSRVLRGYDRGRFRDRWIGLGSVTYRFPINRVLAGFTWIDAGQAFRSVDAFDATELRFGYGGGLQLHTAEQFLARLQVGGGDDGLVINLSFSPAVSIQRRTKRR